MNPGLNGARVHAAIGISIPVRTGYVVEVAGTVIVDETHAGHIGNNIPGKPGTEAVKRGLNESGLFSGKPVGSDCAHSVYYFRVNFALGVNRGNDFRDTDSAHRNAGRDAADRLKRAFITATCFGHFSNFLATACHDDQCLKVNVFNAVALPAF